jgi:hypothetical protein
VSPPHAGRNLAVAATLAAVAAGTGDLLLLWVANAARPELALPRPPDGALFVGFVLGVLAIPLYGLGYRHVGRVLEPASPRGARVVFLAGAYGGALGGVVHGMTTLAIRIDADAAAPPADPLTLAGRYGTYLYPLWGAIAVLAVVGAAVYATLVLRGGTAYPRWMALVNPVTLLLVVGALGPLHPLLGAFAVPAGPNLVHVVFFALAAACVG